MSVALRGNLRDFGIAEVFQLIGQQRKTGLLDVTQGKQTLRLAFDAGCVVWGRPVGTTDDGELGERFVRCGLITQDRLAELRTESEGSARPVSALAIDAGDVSAPDAVQIEQLITNETIFVVLRWSEGSFDFSAQPVRHAKSPETLLAAEQILMDGLRMVDEWQTFAQLVRDGDTIFERNGLRSVSTSFAFAEAKESRSRRLPAIEKVFAAGRRAAHRARGSSTSHGSGSSTPLASLAELHQHGRDRPARQTTGRSRLRKSSPVACSRVDRARRSWWIAAAVPSRCCPVAVSLLVDRTPALRQGPPVFPIVRTPAARIREAGLREAARTERARKRNICSLAHGPKFWENLAPGRLIRDMSGLTGSDALTAAGGDAYYYARRGNGIVLLAPER